MGLDRACDRDAGALRVDYRAHQGDEVLHPRGLRHLLERIGARPAELDLTQRSRHQQRERPFLVADELLQRAIQAESRLHADGDDVEGVGQCALELAAALAHELVQP